MFVDNILPLQWLQKTDYANFLMIKIVYTITVRFVQK